MSEQDQYDSSDYDDEGVENQERDSSTEDNEVVAPPPVEVSPTQESDVTTTRIAGQEYTVDPNKGYRYVAGASAE